MVLKHKEDSLKFQGENKNDKYFEGWYFKQVSADLKKIISIIPGICKGRDSHAFIQAIISYEYNDEIILKTYYYKFSSHEFKYKNEPFCLRIGNNKFNNEYITLDLTSEECSIQGKINFSKFSKIKRSIFFPNARGFFGYLPFMECYHDIISMNHSISGVLTVNNMDFDFSNGKGYIEKDWGTSFPKEYMWLQSNHFVKKGASIMFSLAHIPFLGISFQGFICNLTFDGEEYRFATYNNSKIASVKYFKNLLEVTVVKGAYELIIKAKITHDYGDLKAPVNGEMNNIIKEGLSGFVDIILLKNSKMLFKGKGNPCAIEIHK